MSDKYKGNTYNWKVTLTRNGTSKAYTYKPEDKCVIRDDGQKFFLGEEAQQKIQEEIDKYKLAMTIQDIYNCLCDDYHSYTCGVYYSSMNSKIHISTTEKSKSGDYYYDYNKNASYAISKDDRKIVFLSENARQKIRNAIYADREKIKREEQERKKEENKNKPWKKEFWDY